MGGRGSTSKIIRKDNPAGNMSSLEAFRENARQFNLAVQEAKKQKASVLEFTDITGTTYRRYWNGATYVDRKGALYEKEMQGTYKAQFRKKK